MITVGVIKNGARYLSRHLRKNDYWAEGERQVQGEWIGEGARALGLEGPVTEPEFEALRKNRHPHTGDRLTLSEKKNRVAFFDIQLSAPKDMSVLAMVGGDERVRSLFYDSAKLTLEEMEQYAAVRERRGDAKGTEAVRLTRNYVGALFLHDASRDLDPQLHVHAVLANATWDADREEWLALQPAEMLRASRYLRQVLYRELSRGLRELGYDTYEMSTNGFSIRGVEHLRERFSQRSRHVDELAQEFEREKGRKPSKREREVLVKGSRADKLTEVSTDEVRQLQHSQLSGAERSALLALVAEAEARPKQMVASHGLVRSVLEAGLQHVYERNSVARWADVLSAALELHPDFYRWRELRQSLEKHPDAIHRQAELTLRSIAAEESRAARRLRDSRNTCAPLAAPDALPVGLTEAQAAAARALLTSRDRFLVLIGDAGTGKTTLLAGLEAAHLRAAGSAFVPLAPTTRARDALAQSGFAAADTVQRFLVSEAMQAESRGRVLLVDEAGLLSTQQMDQLTRVATEMRARVLLVGDAKQHTSVQRGDALRNLIRQTDYPVVRLTEVLRQRTDADRRLSRLLAAGDATGAVVWAGKCGLIEEIDNDDALFRRAAEVYAHDLAEGRETLVVIPVWEEIDRFTVAARAALQAKGILGDAEVERQAVKPLDWTQEQKRYWDQYRQGDRLLFVRSTRQSSRGASLEVKQVLANGLIAVDSSGRAHRITSRQTAAFEVGRLERLALAAGDRVLVRGREDTHKLQNGDLKEVAQVDRDSGQVRFADGTQLPAEFHAWNYGHALTTYRAQGSTAEHSLLVLGGAAAQSLRKRQFYVGSTRYRGSHRILMSDRAAVMRALSQPDAGRELATEFLERQDVSLGQLLLEQRLGGLRERARAIWRAMVERWMERQTNVQQQQQEI